MAEALQLQADFADCRLCGWFASSSLLPCGHVFCRKCLRHTLDAHRFNPACPLCRCPIPAKLGESVKEAIDGLCKDPILEDLVRERVARSEKVLCISCKKKQATHACLDCAECYCRDCCTAHGRMGVAKDHVLQDLFQGSHFTPGSDDHQKQGLSRDYLEHGLFGYFKQEIARQSISGEHLQQGLSDRAKQDLSRGTAATDRKAEKSAPTPEDDALAMPADVFFQQFRSATAPKPNTAEDFLAKQATAYENRVYLLENAVSTVDATIAQLHEVKNTLEKQQYVLKKYATGLYGPHPELVANACAVLPRLKCVLSDCRPPPDDSLNTLRQDVGRLVQFYTKPGIPFDPLTCTPTADFTTRPVTSGDDDSAGPYISFLLPTADGRVVMADHTNGAVKVADLTRPASTITSVQLNARGKQASATTTVSQTEELSRLLECAKPWGLALLRNGHVVVTSNERRVYFVDIDRMPPAVESEVPTARQYWGVGVLPAAFAKNEGGKSDRLVVSCVKDSDGPASVDVIALDGVVLKTVTDNSKLGSLVSPKHLSVTCSSTVVLVSDKTSNVVFCLDLDTGRVTRVLTHSHLVSPRQVATDPQGNSYVASYDGKCIMVLTSSGQWRKLVDEKWVQMTSRAENRVTSGVDSPAPEVGVYPYSVCVVSWGIIVAWNDPDGACWLQGLDLTVA